MKDIISNIDPNSAINVVKVNRDKLHPGSLKSYFVPEVYTDEKCVCRGCEIEFVFTALQKQRLYEDHKRHIAVRRVLCGDCKGDLTYIEKELIKFDEKLKNKDRINDMNAEEFPRMMEMLKRKFKYTQKVDKTKMLQYKKIHKILTSR